MTTTEFKRGVYAVFETEGLHQATLDGWQVDRVIEDEHPVTIEKEVPDPYVEKEKPHQQYGHSQQHRSTQFGYGNVPAGFVTVKESVVAKRVRYLLVKDEESALAELQRELLKKDERFNESAEENFWLKQWLLKGQEFAEKFAKEIKELTHLNVSNRERFYAEQKKCRKYEEDHAKLRKAIGELRMKEILKDEDE